MSSRSLAPEHSPPRYRVDGGPGNDNIFAVGRRPTTIRCGSGFDTVELADKDRAAKDCERRIPRR